METEKEDQAEGVTPFSHVLWKINWPSKETGIEILYKTDYGKVIKNGSWLVKCQNETQCSRSWERELQLAGFEVWEQERELEGTLIFLYHCPKTSQCVVRPNTGTEKGDLVKNWTEKLRESKLGEGMEQVGLWLETA